ncbi:SLC13 family permease [Idiomarina xiamenensis]|uniref:Na+/H+ antiporter NhaD-like permease n=1 Tax=Idiomarina xiamenensis 10-D-4 TaxID=740709 RepID=K2KLE9_9GAMM|nr:SLC13 family permease [Idiomarina xiamenensis]EKE83354.1 Na+/H+ antiporter NhaD-like permease [Idiomarina xiamenensis 10-D-4]
MSDISILIISLLVIWVLARGSLPFTQIGRTRTTTAAAIACALIEGITPAQAFAYIDSQTLLIMAVFLLVGANLAQLRGATSQSSRLVLLHPLALLGLVMLSCALLSMVMINDVVVALLAPLLLLLPRQSYSATLLIGLALASNIGSAASILGNPQNIILASHSGLSQAQHLQQSLAAAILSLVLAFVIIVLLKYRNLQSPQHTDRPAEPLKARWSYQQWLTLAVAITVISSMTLTSWLWPQALQRLSLICLALLLLSMPRNRIAVLKQANIPLLVLIASLFVLTHTVSTALLSDNHNQTVVNWLQGSIDSLNGIIGFSVVASNTIGNVPAIILLLSVLDNLSHSQASLLAYFSSVAGNLLLQGSLASIIVVEIAKKRGISIGFRQFAALGIPVTVAAIISGILLL